MLWFKSLHIIFMVTWFAGLFYLPRIFVYHAMSDDPRVTTTFKVMERRLMVMTHLGGALTWVFGGALLMLTPGLSGAGWMRLKLALVVALLIYHFWCAHIVKELAADRIRHSHIWYRWFNEFPTVILIAVVILVVVKPF